MRKALFFIAFCAVVCGVFCTACSKNKARVKNPDLTLTLALRSGTYAEVIKKCLPAFEIEHNILCEVKELSEDDLHHLVASDVVNAEGAYDGHARKVAADR